MKVTIKIAIVIMAIIFTQLTLACSDVRVIAQDGTVMIGRTLEFGPNVESDLISSQRGRIFKTTAPDGKQGLSWKAKYGYLYIDGFHLNFPLDGMNEKGLAFEALYLPGFAQYQTVTPTEDQQAIPYYKIGDWILGNFASVQDVKKALFQVKIFAKPLSSPGHPNVVFPLHFAVTDATGQSIIVEYVKGKLHIYANKLGVMTNSPPYNWQLTNLRNYVNLSPYALKTLVIDGYHYSATGQGAGMLGLPGDSTPPSRFVKLAFLVKSVVPAANAQAALILAEHILDTVFIPKGMVQGVKGSNTPMDTTQWTVFKDLTHRILYFNSYNNPTLKSIALDKVNFSPSAKQFKMPIASKRKVVNVTKQFK